MNRCVIYLHIRRSNAIHHTYLLNHFLNKCFNTFVKSLTLTIINYSISKVYLQVYFRSVDPEIKLSLFETCAMDWSVSSKDPNSGPLLPRKVAFHCISHDPLKLTLNDEPHKMPWPPVPLDPGSIDFGRGII